MQLFVQVLSFFLVLSCLLFILVLGDPTQIHPFLDGIANQRRASRESESDLGAAALHLAIRCASGAPDPLSLTQSRSFVLL